MEPAKKPDKEMPRKISALGFVLYLCLGFVVISFCWVELSRSPSRNVKLIYSPKNYRKQTKPKRLAVAFYDRDGQLLKWTVVVVAPDEGLKTLKKAFKPAYTGVNISQTGDGIIAYEYTLDVTKSGDAPVLTKKALKEHLRKGTIQAASVELRYRRLGSKYFFEELAAWAPSGYRFGLEANDMASCLAKAAVLAAKCEMDRRNWNPYDKDNIIFSTDQEEREFMREMMESGQIPPHPYPLEKPDKGEARQETEPKANE